MSSAEPLHLGIDTSTAWLGLSLYCPRTQAERAGTSVRAERRHAELLVPLLHGLLSEHGLSPAAITAIGCGTGPGSYTGLRVGLAAAAGLAAGLGVPLAGTGSLEAAAWGSLTPGQTGWPVFDARRGNVYTARVRRTPGGVQVLLPARKLPLAEVRELARRLGEDVIPEPVPAAAWIAARAAAGAAPAARYL
ncbi:MAG TPA: tRNA (adenosine(37)-N6)-threonylcarbamoyltransferase complex dimerization subunit type 1 TsaB [Deinococcales bacterium]|nr:tRNA (adenosine(37)-N6)-threonylcarbamoyltransferase complex dimerization subunit type 1 TsaB [Deinococcales bacterium]